MSHHRRAAPGLLLAASALAFPQLAQAATDREADLLARLERVAQLRYAAALATQQDAIRAQLEQTAMQGELLMLAGERRKTVARLNALLARDPTAPLAAPERVWRPRRRTASSRSATVTRTWWWAWRPRRCDRASPPGA